MAATKSYRIESVTVEEFKSGPRAGQRKPIRVPKDAQLLGVVSGYGLRVFYAVPAA